MFAKGRRRGKATAGRVVRWPAAGRTIGICAAIAMVTLWAVALASAEPARGWDANQDPPRNWTASDYGSQLKRQYAEIAALNEELGKEPSNSVLEGIQDLAFGCVVGKLGSAAKAVYELAHNAKSRVGQLSFAQKIQLRDRDLTYVTWLNNWFQQYDPGYKNGYDHSKRWLTNQKSPFHQFYKKFRSLLRPYQTAGCCAARGSSTATNSSPTDTKSAGCVVVPCGSDEARQLEADARLAEVTVHGGYAKVTITPPGKTFDGPQVVVTYCYSEPVTISASLVPDPGYRLDPWGVSGYDIPAHPDRCDNDTSNKSPKCTIHLAAGSTNDVVFYYAGGRPARDYRDRTHR
jgi:hypothetical protein